MIPETIVDLIETTLESPLDPELVDWPRQASVAQLRRLAEAHESFERRATIKPKPPEVLRPYIPLDVLAYTPGRQYVPWRTFWSTQDFSEPPTVQWKIEVLHHHLLYCHSLVLDNPLAWILDSFRSDAPPRLTAAGLRHAPIEDADSTNVRQELANYLALVSQVKDLIQSGVLIFAEPYGRSFEYEDDDGNVRFDPDFVDPYERPEEEMRQVKRLASLLHRIKVDFPRRNYLATGLEPLWMESMRPDFSDVPKHLKAAMSLQAIQNWNTRATDGVWQFMNDAVMAAADGILTGALHGGRVDRYYPYQHHREAAEWVLKKGRRFLEADADEDFAVEPDIEPVKSALYQGAPTHEEDERLLNELIALALPSLQDLSTSEVVRIRASGEAFEDWRLALRMALRTVTESADLSPADRARLVADQMNDARAALDQKLRKSSISAQFDKGAIPFLVGAALELALTPVTGPPSFLKKGATSSIGLLWNKLIGCDREALDHAIYQHYLVFQPRRSNASGW